VVIRSSGGGKGEFGPIRKKRVQILAVCDSMLAQIQDLVQSNPELCASLQ
jgi:hypothetical protein